MSRSGLAALVLSLAGVVFALAVVRPKSWPTSDEDSPSRSTQDVPAPRSVFEAVVTRVIDGDTVKLRDGRELRYAGIDCAEKGEAFAEEAKARNRALVEGKRLRVEMDDDTIDRFGRVLGYAFVEPSTKSINETLAEEGLAVYFFVPPNKSHAPQLLAAQSRARENHRGIWSQEVAHREASYVGSTDRFHRPDCLHVNAIQHRTTFATRDQALDTGRSPCRTCKP